MSARCARLAAVVTVFTLAFVPGVRAQGQNPAGRGQAGPPPTPRAAAPIDLTGYWVSVVTEDWRYRMVTPTRGDYQGVPMTPAAIKVADAWDPAKDEAAGLQCKSYGAAAIMHVAGRIRFTWQDDRTLKMETDNGTQTRLFRFEGSPAARAGRRSWQGDSVARWESNGRGRGAGGSLRVVTTNLLAGYLRKNGVPYSENIGLTEYFDVAPLPSGGQVLVATVVVDDPMYLDRQFVVASQFKKEPDGSKWDPTPCSSTW
jgi:hypothetical protein